MVSYLSSTNSFHQTGLELQYREQVQKIKTERERFVRTQNSLEEIANENPDLDRDKIQRIREGYAKVQDKIDTFIGKAELKLNNVQNHSRETEKPGCLRRIWNAVVDFFKKLLLLL